jgi:hypothetical protein
MKVFVIFVTGSGAVCMKKILFLHENDLCSEFHTVYNWSGPQLRCLKTNKKESPNSFLTKEKVGKKLALN